MCTTHSSASAVYNDLQSELKDIDISRTRLNAGLTSRLVELLTHIAGISGNFVEETPDKLTFFG